MDERIFGYVRVSSKDQNEDRQIIAMEEFGVPPKNMVCEKLSGKDFNRPGYRKLIRKMRAGDILVKINGKAIGCTDGGYSGD